MSRALLLSLVLLCTTAACGASDRWYVEPSNESVDYDGLSRPAQAIELRTFVSWSVNGYANSRQDLVLELTRFVQAVLEKSGVVMPTRGAQAGVMEVHLSTGSYRKPVFQRRGPGARARWPYSMWVQVNTGAQFVEKQYDGALLIYRGNAVDPDRLESVDPDEAHRQLVERLLLRALRDLQREGMLPAK